MFYYFLKVTGKWEQRKFTYFAEREWVRATMARRKGYVTQNKETGIFEYKKQRNSGFQYKKNFY